MIPLLTSAQMRELDRAAIQDYQIPGRVLMELAGRGVAEAARALLLPGGAAAIVCGKGNNGGDGFVAARWLARWGYRPTTILCASPADLTGDAAANLALLRRFGLPLVALPDQAALGELLAAADLVIDALLGTGVSGPPREPLAGAIRAVLAAGRPVLAVDLPSGVDADTGEAHEPHVRAVRTVTLAGWKRGLAVTPGAVAAGVVECVDLGLPHPPLAALGELPGLLEPADLAALVPRRARDAHKGDAGRVVILGGSPGFAGAPVLAARAAARGGAGLVTLAVPSSLAGAATASLEIMTRALPLAGDDLAPDALATIAPLLTAADALAVGPGWGTSAGAAAVLRDLLARAACPVVVDADALNLLALTPGLRTTTTQPVILTPHPGEAARLLGSHPDAIQRDRLGAATDLASRYEAVVVLKGAGSVIAAPDGRLRVCGAGTPAMASGGLGDALTGLVAALLAQGLAPFAAAQAGTWLHARAAELAARGTDAGLLASDVIEALPVARRELPR